MLGVEGEGGIQVIIIMNRVKLKKMLTSLSLAFLLISMTVAAGVTFAGSDTERTRITAEDLKALIRGGQKVTLIDVRTPEEYEGGHIPGARLVPLSKIVHLDDLPHEGTVVLYCRSGQRSARARTTLAARGIEGLLDLEGGIKAWMAAGGNVVAGPAGPEVDAGAYPPSYVAPLESCDVGDKTGGNDK
jgi:rhodanese-related sulfurtransferase